MKFLENLITHYWSLLAKEQHGDPVIGWYKRFQQLSFYLDCA